MSRNGPIMTDPSNPLVSILVFNYNYGRYLRQCLESAYAQTYKNIEICFSDNASTDESWDIALEFARKYPGTMNLTCNRVNFGSDANFQNCFHHTRGKYFIELCSDDALEPQCVEKCVKALQAHPGAGFAMVNRSIIDENGKIIEEPPFYNQSCLIPGSEQAAVYMMAAVNPSITQVMYVKRMMFGKGGSGGLAGQWYGNRIQDFQMCCEFPIVYIKDPLVLHRLHAQNDSSQAAQNLIEILGPYVLRYQFAETASSYNLPRVMERLSKSIEKLAQLSLRYSLNMINSKNERSGLRYFHLATAIQPEIAGDPIYAKLQNYWSADAAQKAEVLKSLGSIDNFATRSVSYDPPPGSIPLNI